MWIEKRSLVYCSPYSIDRLKALAVVPVSYPHLTLPTIGSVYVSAVSLS